MTICRVLTEVLCVDSRNTQLPVVRAGWRPRPGTSRRRAFAWRRSRVAPRLSVFPTPISPPIALSLFLFTRAQACAKAGEIELAMRVASEALPRVASEGRRGRRSSVHAPVESDVDVEDGVLPAGVKRSLSLSRRETTLSHARREALFFAAFSGVP